jgi:hypothetical protein
MASTTESVTGHEVACFAHDLNSRILENVPASLEADRMIITQDEGWS